MNFKISYAKESRIPAQVIVEIKTKDGDYIVFENATGYEVGECWIEVYREAEGRKTTLGHINVAHVVHITAETV